MNTNARLIGAAQDLLHSLHEDPNRSGLLGTPERFVSAWEDITDGYTQDPVELIKLFQNDEAGDCTTVSVVVRDIPFYSLCEHHMLPFFGHVTIGVVPSEGGAFTGLSKYSRVVNVFAHRLQVQERLTREICDTLFRALSPEVVAVRVKARHLCMEMRGVENLGVITDTQCSSFDPDAYHKSRNHADGIDNLIKAVCYA